MASAFAHAAVGAALWPWFKSNTLPRRTWIAGCALAVLPDIDYVGFRFGVPYDSVLGHRGITHSIAFALVAASIVASILFRAAEPPARHRGWWYLALAAITHPILDAMTTGGLGVAFFAPFWNRRYFFPFRPILVSPLSIHRFLSASGLAILLNEAFWVGIPALLLAWLGLRWQSSRVKLNARAV